MSSESELMKQAISEMQAQTEADFKDQIKAKIKTIVAHQVVIKDLQKQIVDRTDAIVKIGTEMKALKLEPIDLSSLTKG